MTSWRFFFELPCGSWKLQSPQEEEHYVTTHSPCEGREVSSPSAQPQAQTHILTCECRDLYRRSLKLALDWAVQRNLWRGQAVYIRSLFDANRNIHDPRQRRVRISLSAFFPPGRLSREKTETDQTELQVLFVETEKLLEKWKHPDPYRPPSAPGGETSFPSFPPTARAYDRLAVQEGRRADTSTHQQDRNMNATSLHQIYHPQSSIPTTFIHDKLLVNWVRWKVAWGKATDDMGGWA